MPIESIVLPEHNLVLTRVTGELADRELMTYLDQVRADRRLSPGRLGLADVRDMVVGSSLTLDGIRAVGELDRQDAGIRRGRLAVVASTEVIFGFARVYAAHAETAVDSVKVFRTVAEAIRWLGLDVVADEILTHIPPDAPG